MTIKARELFQEKVHPREHSGLHLCVCGSGACELPQWVRVEAGRQFLG